MRVDINGLGIAGPTLAYWLRRSAHDPVLFEKAREVRSGGYLIDFWGLGYDIAERMGVISTLHERSYQMQRLRMVDRNGLTEGHMDLAPLYDMRRPGVRVTARHCVEGTVNGSRVTLSLDFSGPLGSLCARLTRGLNERYLALEARGLKNRAETRAQATEDCVPGVPQ